MALTACAGLRLVRWGEKPQPGNPAPPTCDMNLAYVESLSFYCQKDGSGKCGDGGGGGGWGFRSVWCLLK